MAEPTKPAVAPHDATPVQTGDRESNAATATELLCQTITSLVDFVYPTSIRSEYLLILSKLSKNRFTCILLGVLLIVSVAEYEQPGWFPRPDQLSSAVIGFLGACTFILAAFAVFEYEETHSWPWEDEGFVWPWEALLWSSTVYDDETFGESTLGCTYPHDVPTSLALQARLDKAVGDHGRASRIASDGIIPSSIPGTSQKQDIVIPPTPFLLHQIGPAHLSSPIKHRSGLLGPSPMPARFQSTNGKSGLEWSELGDKRAT
ncbi:hypothetical protein yc1106_05051 [Curvularia clavata]|uniref:Uncharacterized protein n=1 Tax=Curvularia clavata TaxID=95742 RepID=A0A9Q8Z8Z1_CURCL|nr:hypothetical protein yc1106_05051 [Curvularia clavata]